ncbi:response regulator transcription factor [Myxococcota bacterium]|nr:response regulator transcription factor [Myxococcota bacterium]
MAKILIVDDDPHIREVVCFALERAGHQVVARADGRAGLDAAQSEAPDLVVLDILMPELDGIEVCRRIRQRSVVPVLFLSSKDDELDKVIGLEVGGDDYITKPFSARELAARVKAMLRRVELARSSALAEPAPTPKRHGALALDAERFEVTWRGTPVVLTVTEFGVLETLIESPGKVFTRGELVERAYRFDNHVTERTIDTHVKRIRKKFGALREAGDAGAPSATQPIETVFGLGYRLDAGPSTK